MEQFLLNYFFTSVKGIPTDSSIMLISTEDWTDEEKTMSVARVIRDLGITGKLVYKPDLYSTLQIFRSNIYNLKPSVYSYQ